MEKNGPSKPSVEQLRERLERAWNEIRAADTVSAQKLGDAVVEHVRARLHKRDSRLTRPDPSKRTWATPEELAEQRRRLRGEADAVRKRYRGKRFKTAPTLEAAVKEYCEAEYGALTGLPFDPRDLGLLRARNVTPPDAFTIAARDAYKGLRKAIDAARALAFKLPTGTGGSAGFALVAMRGMLPVLPPLTEPPFDDAETSDRAVFIREWDLRQRSLARERLTDREMAVVTLLWGFRPLDTFSALSRRKPDGWSVVELIAEEAKRVARVRENSK